MDETTEMIFFAKPDRATLEKVLRSHENLPFSYPEVGLTLDSKVEEFPELRRRYRLLHKRTYLGKGDICFERAKQAIFKWRMFDLDWLQFCCWDMSVHEGGTVAILGRTLGVWWFNPCRIISLIDHEGPVERFGFTYGTLSSNSVSGEERILVEWDRRDDTVHYDLLSFSRPNQWTSRISFFYLRYLQERFGRESGQVVRRYVLA